MGNTTIFNGSFKYCFESVNFGATFVAVPIHLLVSILKCDKGCVCIPLQILKRSNVLQNLSLDTTTVFTLQHTTQHIHTKQTVLLSFPSAMPLYYTIQIPFLL